MDNKEIQRQRMMRYFIDATKEIIKEEGLKGISVRKVGEKAGYSYATIYNYFNDLNTLLNYCVFDFLEDCYKYMISFKNDELNPREQIIIYASAYIKYFVKNPDLFQLIFLEELGRPPENLLKKDRKPSIGLLLNESLTECAKDGFIADEDTQLLQELIGSYLRGKLVFFLKRGHAQKLDNILLSVKDEIGFLLKEKEVSNE